MESCGGSFQSLIAAAKRVVLNFSGKPNPCSILQGLRPFSFPEAPAPVFATPTKLPSDGSYEYLGKNKVPELQKIFQKPDGIPVHLKRGYSDKLLYRTTMALTVGGVVYVLVALYMAAQPKKN